MSDTWSLILPAAGSGRRFGGPTPKQYLMLGHHPVIAHALRTALSVEGLVSILIAVQPDQRAVLTDILGRAGISDPRIHIVDGAHERQYTIANALQHPAVADAHIVLVHDAVRPLASADLFRNIVQAAALHGAAIPCLPVKDTVKRVDASGHVVATLERGELRSVQTPQGALRTVMLEAYDKARRDGILGTDDASLIEAAGHAVICIDGEEANIKITSSFDMILAETLLLER